MLAYYIGGFLSMRLKLHQKGNIINYTCKVFVKAGGKMKTGLVLEGGALRAIFSSGVCDAMLESGLMTDYVVGVSAGIAYGVSYVSRQPKT